MSTNGSVISTTDLEIFKNIANPQRIDIKQDLKGKKSLPDIPPTVVNQSHNPPSNRNKSRSKSPSPSSTPSRSRSRSSSPQHSKHSSVSSTSSKGSRHSRRHSLTSSRSSHSNRSRHSPHDSPRSARSPRSPRSRKSPKSFRRFPPPPIVTDEDVIPPYRTNPSNPFRNQNQPSAFDQETRRYMEGMNSSRPTPPSQNPFDNTHLVDPIISPVREHHHSRRPYRNHHRHHNRHALKSSKSRSRSRSRSSSSNRNGHRNRSHSSPRSPLRLDHTEENKDQNILQEKRKYLLQLEKLRLQGVRLTKDYNMNDSIIDIRFEYDCHQSNYEVVDTIKFMKDGLNLLFLIIEAGNQKFGPILRLEGWSSYMSNNMARFDRVLERIYHRMWRHGSMNPYVEFGWLIFGSMIMWHLQNRYLGGLPVESMVMGNQGTRSTNSNQTSGGGQTNSGGGFSLGGIGNLLRMFTGGGGGGNATGASSSNGNGNVNASNSSTNNPSAPNIATTGNRNIATSGIGVSNSNGSANRGLDTRQPARQQPLQNHNMPNTPSQIPISTSSSKPSQNYRPVTPTAQVASLPPMNVRGISGVASQTTPPPNQSSSFSRQPLRRPSAHLRDGKDNNNNNNSLSNHFYPTPLSPVMESRMEENIPSPP